ncbi:YaaR family protein [Ectobacillus sp. JY-23]|uniref:YaaR family protein n=1 Tax=Ectobacillus sp. JY-23 TaxID=2933872 RepID=UPI0034A07D96
MMRSVSLNPAFINPVSTLTPSKEGNALSPNFYKVLHEGAQNEDAAHKMEELLQGIEHIKEKIQVELTIDNVMEYKDAVKSFLNFYVDHLMQYQDVMSRHPKYGYAQKMTVVKRVEAEMNELEDVMNLINTKTGHLETLNKIGEIHGLIVNVVL